VDDDVLSLLLRAEAEYHGAVKKAAQKAEAYAESQKNEQAAYLEELKREWQLFEKAENAKLDKALLDDELKMENESIKLKAQMKTRQGEKADLISERLKKEVLSLIWR
jgi:hypothetical protein